jgi:phosphoglycerate dehydrogenase-like enzyme
MRLAILDDYQSAALHMADWASAPEIEVVPFTDHVHDPGQLVARLRDFDAVMRIRERTEFPRAVLEALPRLKLMLATGMRISRSIDLPATRELGITVCSTQVHHHTTVELAWGLILGLMRRIHTEAASLRAGGWQIGFGQGLSSKTLGVLGLGSMGVPVAQIGKLFGMNVVAWSPNLTPERTAPHGVTCVSKAELFAEADVLTIHIPHSDSTAGIVGAADIARMKRSAYLINTSRPALIDQPALIAALSERRIAGAGLDVYDIEPLPIEHPYRSLPTVLATPHIGFVTEENHRIFYEQSLENAKAWLAGAPIRVVNGAVASELIK